MLDIKVKIDAEKVIGKLGSIAGKQSPFAISRTLNQLAYNIARKEMPKQAQKTFEGGATAFTRRGFKYAKSTKRKLSAFVFVDKKQSEYLKYQIEGGTRRPEKKALLSTTASSKLNKYGNFTRNTVSKMITNKERYFSGTPKGMAPAASNEGIWERTNKNSRIRQVARYKERQAYKPVFKFSKYATDAIAHSRTGFTPTFKKNLEYAIKTAK